MKKSIVPLLFSAVLVLGLTACAPANPEVPFEEGPAPTILDAMGILPEEEAYLTNGMREIIDQTATQDDMTLHILETLGDGHYLYVLYALSIPEGEVETPTQDDLMSFYLSAGVDTPAEHSGIASDLLRYDPSTRQLYCLSCFDFGKSSYTGQAFTFQLENQTPTMLFLDVPLSLSLTWTPNNIAPTVTAESPDGVCTLSPLRMDLELTVDPPAEALNANDVFEHIGKALTVTYTDGTSQNRFFGGTGLDRPITLFGVPPHDGTLFHLPDLESVTLYDTTFTFSNE